MKIINSQPIFDLINHGFTYLCQADDGSYWLRSVAGTWTKISTNPSDTYSIDKDFEAYLLANNDTPAPEAVVQTENAGQTIVEPVFVPLPEPAPEPVADPAPTP